MIATLITGASGGLGAEFARVAASRSQNVVLVARSTPLLETLAHDLRTAHDVQVTVLTEDLSDPKSVTRIITALTQGKITIDTLINNAGTGLLHPFASTDTRTINDMLALNITTLTLLTRALLPPMIARGSGRILNVASTAAFQPGPLMAVYYATKAYVLHWSLAIGNELAGTGVTVTCLCPGPTHTGFQQNAGMQHSPLFKSFHTLPTDRVVRAGYEGMLRGRSLVIPGIWNKLSVFGTRLVPRTLAARAARMAQE